MRSTLERGSATRPGPVSITTARSVRSTTKSGDTLGPKTVIGYAQRMGISSPIPPYLSSAIGAGEATLLEMTSAYTAFPNQGVRMAPLLMTEVTDREGNVLEQKSLRLSEAYRPPPEDSSR